MHLIPILVLESNQNVVSGDSGVIYENIDGAERGFNLFNKLAASLGVRNIAGVSSVVAPGELLRGSACTARISRDGSYLCPRLG